MIVFSENFSSFALGDRVNKAGAPYSVLTQDGSLVTVQADATWLAPALQTVNGANWDAVIRNDRKFSVQPQTTFTYSARCGTTNYNGIIWHIQSLVLDGVTSVGCYGFVFQPGNQAYIQRGWMGGVGGVTILTSTNAPPAVNANDYTLSVQQTGNTITAFVNGKPILTAVDNTYTSGYVGLQTLTANSFFSNLTVDDGKGAKVNFVGLDLTPYVLSWGAIEQIKEILLSQSQFFTSQMTFTFQNKGNFLSTFTQGNKSTVGGIKWYNKVLSVTEDGTTIYQGFIKNIPTNENDQIARIITENVLKRPAESIFNGTQNNVNPASAMLGILSQAGLLKYTNVASFIAAGGDALANNANVNYNFPQGGNNSVLQAVQKIGALASISVFVYNNQIFARRFYVYQGSGSGLKFPITNSIVLDWGDLEWDIFTFNNQVSVGYSTTYYTATNQASVNKNNITRGIEFSNTDVVVASDLNSATYFANQYLNRAAFRRPIVLLNGRAEFKKSKIGDRHPVTIADLGLSAYPMEIIELHRVLDSDVVQMRLVGLS